MDDFIFTDEIDFSETQAEMDEELLWNTGD